MTNKTIAQLVSFPGLKVECPSCGESFPVKRGKLVSMYDHSPAVQKIIHRRLAEANAMLGDIQARKKQLAEDRKRKPERISISALGSNFGQISEQILPAFITFPYRRNECRILFKPIDYIVFMDLCKKGRVEAIKFVDVKTGNARLDRRQVQIRDRILDGKIKHRVLS